jgi:hypothetical protein
LPKEKGISSLLPFLPDLKALVHQISLAAAINQPGATNTPNSLSYLFNNPGFQARINKETHIATKENSYTLSRFSRDIKEQRLNGKGYSQGIIFI